jgi:hypothetical protein
MIKAKQGEIPYTGERSMTGETFVEAKFVSLVSLVSLVSVVADAVGEFGVLTPV